MSRRVNGKVRNDLSPDAVIKSVHIAQGSGSTSAYTWLKLPVVAEMERVMDGDDAADAAARRRPGRDPDETYAGWEKALRSVGARAHRRAHAALPARRRREAAVDAADRAGPGRHGAA